MLSVGKSCRALLLDLDGTLMDTMPHLCRSFRHAVEPYVRRPPTDAEIIATFGPPERVNLELLLTNPDLARPDAVTHLDTAEQRFHQHYEGRHGEVVVFAGIPEALALARERGWRMGIFTGKSRRSALFALESLGLAELAECLVSGTDVQKPKPDPEGVLLAAKTLGTMPNEMLLVGDSPGDVKAAKRAGAIAVGALWGAFDPDATRAAGPLLVLETVEQFSRLIAGK